MVTSLRPKPGAARRYRFPQFHDEVLPSGIRLLTAPVNKLPIATILVIVDAGSVNELRGKEGIAALTAAGLLEGTNQFDGAELAQKFEQLGTSLESGADWDSAFVTITVLSDKLEEATRLLGEVISSPVFPEREVERLKAERLAEILQLESEPRGLADEKFAEFLYAPESRYSRPDEGSSESVSGLTRDDVEEFYRSNYRARGTTVIVVGDVTSEQARAIVADAFKKWPTGSRKEAQLTTASRAKGRNVHILHKPDAPQSELRVGHVGLPRRHRDFFPTLVMNAVLGGLFGSRINLNLREVHGYTYGASSHYDWRRGAGPFVVSTAVQSEVTAPALTEILLEIDRIRSDKISDEELTLARDYLEGVFPIRYESTAAIATALATLVVHSLPADYYDVYRKNIHSVSADAVLAAANAHLHPQELQTVIVGDANTIQSSLVDPRFGELLVHNG
jgi:predicted Zn-dependent peptidase